jgi:hypothetical protein
MERLGQVTNMNVNISQCPRLARPSFHHHMGCASERLENALGVAISLTLTLQVTYMFTLPYVKTLQSKGLK